MIDTVRNWKKRRHKYKGHTPAPWKALFNHPQVEGSCVVSDEDEINFGDTWHDRIHGPLWVGELTDDMPDTKLIADAPLLLAEVNRLHTEIKQFHTFDEYITMLRNGQIDADDICDVWDEIRKEREE